MPVKMTVDQSHSLPWSAPRLITRTTLMQFRRSSSGNNVCNMCAQMGKATYCVCGAHEVHEHVCACVCVWVWQCKTPSIKHSLSFKISGCQNTKCCWIPPAQSVSCKHEYAWRIKINKYSSSRQSNSLHSIWTIGTTLQLKRIVIYAHLYIHTVHVEYVYRYDAHSLDLLHYSKLKSQMHNATRLLLSRSNLENALESGIHSLSGRLMRAIL